MNNSAVFIGTEGGGVWRILLTEMPGIIYKKQRRQGTDQVYFSIISKSLADPDLTIAFDLPHPYHAALTIYDLSGTEITSLVKKQLNRGSYLFHWNTRTMATGSYIAILRAGKDTYVKNIRIMH